MAGKRRVDSDLQVPNCWTVGLGKYHIGAEAPELGGTRFEFYPEVHGKPLEDFMQVRKTIRFNAIKIICKNILEFNSVYY